MTARSLPSTQWRSPIGRGQHYKHYILIHGCHHHFWAVVWITEITMMSRISSLRSQQQQSWPQSP